MSPSDAATSPPPGPPRLWSLFLVEAMTSVGGSFLQVGIFFYTQHEFGWSLRRNFMLATGQGILYIVGALLAHGITQRLGRRLMLIVIYAALAAVCGFAALAPFAVPTAAALLCYTLLIGATWPALESLVSDTPDPHQLSRRIGQYNLVWSGVGAFAVAINGAIIQYWTSGVLILPMILHFAGAILMWQAPRQQRRLPVAVTPVAAGAEVALLRQRTLALWLSRLALPATYVIIYSMMAMMPDLPLLSGMDTSTKTLVSSVWLVTRLGTFALLGATVWWHTRPRLLLLAAVGLLLSFLGTTLSPTLASMLLSQAVLGIALGVIYSASLYFGMVLSEGSTEHGGYHEALIGLGSVLGPGAGAIAQWMWPGSLMAGIGAVGLVTALSVLAATIASLAISARHRG